MAKKRKIPRDTPEQIARWDETTRMVRERIAYHSRMAEKERERYDAAAPISRLRRALFPYRIRLERLD